MDSSISERALLVSLRLSTWQARKYDRKITTDVAIRAGVGSGTGRYNKNLLPGNAVQYAAVQTAASDCRNTFYAQTLPWSQDGSRILPAANFVAFSDVMTAKMESFKLAAETFSRVYPALVESARAFLNGMYDPADYPAVQDLTRRFKVKVSHYPLPDERDFRVDLSAAAVDSIRASIAAETTDAVAEAAKDAWRRLYDACSRMAEKLNDEKAIYRDSLFANLQDVCDVLPRLNVLGDAALDAQVDAVRESVLCHTADECRKVPAARKAAAREAAAIATALEGFI